MPMRTKAYPSNWKEISLQIRERAGWCCEACGVANGEFIIRSVIDPARYMTVRPHESVMYRIMGDEAVRMSEVPDEFLYTDEITVVLTVHHIGVDKPDGTPGDPHDKMDVRDENLVALCQRCHLLADLPLHIANAKATRKRKRHEAILATGQQPLFDESEVG
jgi:hypothetical protein